MSQRRLIEGGPEATSGLKVCLAYMLPLGFVDQRKAARHNPATSAISLGAMIPGPCGQILVSGAAESPSELKTPSWLAAELVQAQAALYSYACAMLGGSADAWDVLQNANKVMLEKASEVQGPQDVMPWAYTVVRFQAMAHRKRASRDRHSSI